MPILASSIGAKLNPIKIEMTRRRLLSFAAAIDDTSERVFNDLDPNFCAVPQICVALEWASIIKNDLRGNLGATREEISRAVHAVQDSVFHRTVTENELLTVCGQITAIWNGRSGTNMITEIISYDEQDKPVFTSQLQSTYRDVSLSGSETRPTKSSITPAEPDEIGDLKSRIINIPLSLPHTFSDCADIWNPIHTEKTVAKQVGLPNIILHGVATWSLAGREILAEFAEQDVTRLKRLRGRMGAMVFPGKPLTINMRANKKQGCIQIWYDVQTTEGAPAIRDGYAEIQ